MSRGNVVPGISGSPSSHFMWIPTFVWKSQFDPGKDFVSDLFLPYICILSVRSLMNNWISIFAHINRQRPIYMTISGKAKLVVFWLSVSVSTRTRSHVETCSTVARTSRCRAASFLVLSSEFARGSNSTLSLVQWTTFELLACILQRTGGLYHGSHFQCIVVLCYKFQKVHVNQNDMCLISFYLE